MVGIKATMLHHIIALFNSKEVVLALILLQLLSSTQGDINAVPDVTVSTVEVAFLGAIREMKPHPSDPNSLLFLSSNKLRSLNVLTNQASTIVGARSHDYVEGVGESARFDEPNSFIINTENKIIVSDTNNHCLREVDLSSRQTSRFAGTCQSYGHTNGAALQAQFKFPRGLLQYKTGILVADYFYSTIRWLSGGVVSTLVDGHPDLLRPYSFTQIEDTVYLSTQSGVMILDPETGSVQLIAGHVSSTGYSDGPLLSARFHDAYDLMSLTPNLILIADNFNNGLRLIDLRNQIVMSICQSYAVIDGHLPVDGASYGCRFSFLWSIAVLNETIYVGSNRKIRTIPLNSILRK